MPVWWILVVSAGAAALVPFAFVTTRESTKRHRQGIVEDLKLVFDKKKTEGDVIIPSFEFVKYKYSVDREPAPGMVKPRPDFLRRHWILSAVPFVLLCTALNALTLAMVLHGAFRQPVGTAVPWLMDEPGLPLFAWVLLAGFAGAALFTLRAFRQAINNFDLSPFSLLGAFVNLVSGVASAPLVVFGVFRLGQAVGLPVGPEGPAAFPFVLVGAFAAGYFPDLAIRTVLRWSRLLLYKREATGIFDAVRSTPLEIIDGIDSEVRSRLEDYHIGTVQNLAAANPLMLFVETPYGVYQIMDWVAQAQLCASVGPAALPKLWALGIRTIFDLERILLDQACRDDVLIATVGAVLWQHPGPLPAGSPNLATLKADIRFRLENPHVHRLRQIFNQVSLSLGKDARKLDPIDPTGSEAGARAPS